jgi:putative transposase
MARKARVVAAGVPHHVTQRGNNRQDVFLTDDDRRYYLSLLSDRSQQAGLRLLGYCLMTNHVHLVAIPTRTDSLARALGRAHSSYAQRFNRLYRRSGHLWQNRFYSCPLGASHLVRALAYVDLNPVRAGLVGWDELCLAADWAAILEQREADTSELRAATYAGLPYGEREFVESLEQTARRPLRRLKPGRKPNGRTLDAPGRQIAITW